MNFLAHLHIASTTQTSFLGNFLGDFVKGNPDTQFTEKTVQGIRLHRFVDSYTDQHEIIRSLKPLFPKPLRRFSPITLDMFWDHCLAKHWLDFNSISLADFCQQTQQQIEVESQLENNALPLRFEKVSRLMWQQRWLESYSKIENINYGLQRMALRSPRMGPLANTGQSLLEHYDLLSEQFFLLYPDLLNKTAEFLIPKELIK